MKKKRMIVLISILLIIIVVQFVVLIPARNIVSLFNDQIDESLNLVVEKLKQIQECLSSERTTESMYSAAPDILFIQSEMNQLGDDYRRLYSGSSDKTHKQEVAVSKVIADIYWYASYDLPVRYSSDESLASIDIKKVELSLSVIDICYTVIDSYNVPSDHFSLKSLSEIYTQICTGIEEHFYVEYGVSLDVVLSPTIFEYIS